MSLPNGLVVDTDVISYMFRKDSRSEPLRRYFKGSLIVVSFMTVAELDRWAVQNAWGAPRRQRMAAFLDQFTMMLVDRELCRTWARAMDQARRNGRPIQVADAWIAATAIALDLPLLTNNRSHFVGVDGLVVLSADAGDGP